MELNKGRLGLRLTVSMQPSPLRHALLPPQTVGSYRRFHPSRRSPVRPAAEAASQTPTPTRTQPRADPTHDSTHTHNGKPSENGASKDHKHEGQPCLHELLAEPLEPLLDDEKPSNGDAGKGKKSLVQTIKDWDAWHKHLYHFKRVHARVLRDSLQPGVRQEAEEIKEERKEAANILLKSQKDGKKKGLKKKRTKEEKEARKALNLQRQITRQWPPAAHAASRPSTEASWPSIDQQGEKEAVEQWYSRPSKDKVKTPFKDGHGKEIMGKTSLRPNEGAELLRRQVVKYGEMAQLTYDVLISKDVNAPSFGSTRLPAEKFFNKDENQTLHYSEDASKYKAFALLHADAGVYKLVRKGDTQRRQHNFVGYVAYYEPEDKDEDIDVVVAWRGSILKDDWIQNLKAVMVGWNEGAPFAATPKEVMDISPWRLVGVTAFWSALVSAAGAQPNIQKLKAAADWLLDHHVLGSVGAAIIHGAEAAVAGGYSAIRGLLEVLAGIGGAVGAAFSAVNAAEGSLWAPVVDALKALATKLHLEDAAEFPSRIVEFVFSLIGWAYQQLPFDVPVALTFAVVVGLVSALVGILRSTEWVADAEKRGNFQIYLDNWGRLLQLVPQWIGWGVTTVLLSRWQRGPKVSYGWKEMYAEADEQGLGDRRKLLAMFEEGGKAAWYASDSKDAGDVYGSPQLQVYHALTDCINKFPKGRQVRITTTGHSLGGALATMCAHDLGLVAGEAHHSEEGAKQLTIDKLLSLDEYLLKEAVLDAKKELMEAMQSHCSTHGSVPVTAVTFASPRVGGRTFAARFGKDHQMPPTFARNSVRLNLLLLPSLAAYWIAQIPGSHVFFDMAANTLFLSVVFGLLGKSPVAPLTITAVGAALLIPPAIYGLAGDLKDILQPKVPPSLLRCLRITNVQDVVPQVPPTLWSVLTGGRLYRHQGVQIMRDAYMMDNFKRDMGFLGIVPTTAALGQRHNLEMYLHLMDPSRRTAWMNKGDNILKPEWRVPASWYVAQRAVIFDAHEQDTYTDFPAATDEDVQPNAP